MKKRRHIPIRWVRKLLQMQGSGGVRPPTCAVAECPTVLLMGPPRNFIVEHKQPRSRGGKDVFKNLELRCKPHADEKTFHPRSLATTLSGDLYEAKKTTRMRDKARTITKPSGKWSKRKRAWPKRKFGA